MSKVIGIDLGTTNSCVSVMEGGRPTVIPNAEGMRTTPSVVAFLPDGSTLVGDPAKRQAVTNPANTVISIKRDMGTRRDRIIQGRKHSPQEISAMILLKLRLDAESYLGESVKDAVITVPAYFNDEQRQATKEAAEIAGLNVKRIINEPTSAALAYGLDNMKSQRILVVDIGGGTSDYSVIEIGDKVIEVLSTSGDTNIGGDNIDLAISEWMVLEFKKQTKIDISPDPIARQRVREAAEKAKKELTAATSTNINLPFIGSDESGPKHLDLTLTRSHFESMISPIVERIFLPMDKAVVDANVHYKDLDKVLLVGGTTRIPVIQDRVRKITGHEPSKSINPDECVALGAAIQGEKLTGSHKSTDIVLLDVTPLTLSVETTHDKADHLIPRNTTIPVNRSRIYSTVMDDQENVHVCVLQGESRIASENKCIGEFTLHGIRRARAGEPQIEITFNIDASGIINVSARDCDTGASHRITISGTSRLSLLDKSHAQTTAHKTEMRYLETKG